MKKLSKNWNLAILGVGTHVSHPLIGIYNHHHPPPPPPSTTMRILTVGHSRTFKFDHYKVLWHVTKPIDDDVRGLVTCYQTVMIGLVTCYRTVMIGPVTCYRTYHHDFLKWFLYHFLNAGIIGNKANILKNIEENLDKHRKSKNLIFLVR